MCSLLLLAGLLGCAPDETPITLLTGWHYRWADLSHRLAYLRVGVAADGDLSLGLVGGDWSTGATYADTPTYRVRLLEGTARGLELARGSVTVNVGPEGTAEALLEIEDPFDPDASLAAVLNGFSIDTDTVQGPTYPSDYDPALGYTSRGFGFALGTVERSAGRLRIPVTATVRWGPQDRADMNAALLEAQTEVQVDILVLATADPAEAETFSGSLDLPWDPPYTEQPVLEASVAFDAGSNDGLYAWRRFSFGLNAEGPNAGEGDYLRAFGAELDPVDPATGETEIAVAMTLSTSSVSERTDPYADFFGEAVRVPVDASACRRVLVSGTHPTGPWTVNRSVP